MKEFKTYIDFLGENSEFKQASKSLQNLETQYKNLIIDYIKKNKNTKRKDIIKYMVDSNFGEESYIEALINDLITIKKIIDNNGTFKII
jgi:hypothetical protein